MHDTSYIESKVKKKKKIFIPTTANLCIAYSACEKAQDEVVDVTHVQLMLNILRLC